MIVVTGASGFLGRTVVRRAAADGVPVLAVSRRRVEVPTGTLARVVDAYDALVPPGEGAVLVHLAESPLVTAAGGDGTTELSTLAALLRQPWAHAVYASSAAVYGGATPDPHPETDPPAPGGAYARRKLAAEALVLAARGTVLRCANLYGPGMARESVLGDIGAQLGRPGPVRVQSLSPIRDFVYGEDAAAAVVAVARQAPGGLFNVGSGVGTSIRDLARLVLRLAGQGDREVVASGSDGAPSTLVLDPSRLKAATGWSATTSLDEGLARLLRSLP